MPTELIACVAAAGCASQYENAAAFTNSRITSPSALVRIHSIRVFVPESGEPADKLARFSTWSPCPPINKTHKCADSGMCITVKE
jgi:hypothetical protein